MKHCAFISLFLTFILFLAGCTLFPSTKDMGEAIGIDVKGSSSFSTHSSYDGGKGSSVTVMSYKSQRLADEIKENENWNKLPLDDFSQKIVYESPVWVNSHDKKNLIPQISEGFYFIEDKLSESDLPLDEKDSMSLVLSIYDTLNNTLYFCTLDK